MATTSLNRVFRAQARGGGHIQADFLARNYREYLPKVLNYIRLRVGNEELAQDLTATVFERAVARIDTLRSEDAFAAWLFRIAHNTVIEYYRRPQPEVPLSPALTAPDPSPEARALAVSELEALVRALSTLPEREQEIIRLRFVAGLKNREIAGVTGLTETNVAVILFRTLRKLRQQLESET
jgi:RNA polymerase sigma factor (sigma-70 family)